MDQQRRGGLVEARRWLEAAALRVQGSVAREALDMVMGTCEAIAKGNLDTGEWPSKKQWQWVPRCQRR